MKRIITIFATVSLLSLVSFKSSPSKLLNTGAYGVCACAGNVEKNKSIELNINEDKSFHFVDYSVPNKKDVTGTWTRKNNTIQLQYDNSAFSIHDKWTIDDNEKCLKSRKGLYFMRLCLIKACK